MIWVDGLLFYMQYFLWVSPEPFNVSGFDAYAAQHLTYTGLRDGRNGASGFFLPMVLDLLCMRSSTPLVWLHSQAQHLTYTGFPFKIQPGDRKNRSAVSCLRSRLQAPSRSPLHLSKASMPTA